MLDVCISRWVHIMRRHGVSYHMYADDLQVYITFKSDDLEDLKIAGVHWSSV